jgi:acetyltransferase-like isoleucine patch superfamily enzyme
MKSNKIIILSDLISSVITLLPGVFTFVLQYLIITWVYSKFHSVIVASAPLLITPFIFILFIYLIRISLPKVKAGRYKMDFNKGFIAWALNLALGRAVRVFQLQDFIYSSFTLKYLYWKAMGADIAFGVNSSMYVNLVDLPLIKVGKGSMLGDEVQIGCHLIQDNAIYLKEVTVGENTFIGINCKLGPGTKIGNNCLVGPWNFFMRNRIKDDEKIEAYEYFKK